MDSASLLRRARGLLVFHGLLATSPLRELVTLLEALTAAGAERASKTEAGVDAAAQIKVAEAYGALFRALLSDAGVGLRPLESATGCTDALRWAIATTLAIDENVLSRYAEQWVAARQSQQVRPPLPGGRPRPPAAPELPPALLAAAAADLRALQALAAAGPLLPRAVAAAAGMTAPPPWPEVPGSAGAVEAGAADAETERRSPEPAATFAARLAAAADWGALAAELAAAYARYGGGLFARYRAFRWVGPQAEGAFLRAPQMSGAASPVNGSAPGMAAGAPGLPPATSLAAYAYQWLLPVPVPDASSPSDLIGYAAERALLRRNTIQFLAGYPANNVLLYGDRGTGKSSSVKALLADGGNGAGEADGVDWAQLRLIEVPKAALADFPLLVSLLRGRPQRFIVFVDDLSYEEGETQYKELKALLEGGLEARPENVVVYATSNRRHLIRERFADRAAPDSDEVHVRDTVEEKLSFADRFGITITFPSPDQATYLMIVEELARRRGLAIEPAVLRARAIEWAAWHNGRSGRTAKQFVDYLEGELGLAQ